MSTVLMRVYPTDRYPFERVEVVEPGTAAGLQRVDWGCTKGCCSYAKGPVTYRRLKTACTKHRSLIPTEEN